jgi:hypothetical protein
MSTNTHKLPEHICQEIRDYVSANIETRDSDGCLVSGTPTCFDVIRTLYDACKRVRDRTFRDRQLVFDKCNRSNLKLLRKTREQFVGTYEPGEPLSDELWKSLVELMITTYPVPPMTEEEMTIRGGLFRLASYYREMHSLMVYTGGDPDEIEYMDLIPAEYQETVTSYLAGVNS